MFLTFSHLQVYFLAFLSFCFTACIFPSVLRTCAPTTSPFLRRVSLFSCAVPITISRKRAAYIYLSSRRNDDLALHTKGVSYWRRCRTRALARMERRRHRDVPQRAVCVGTTRELFSIVYSGPDLSARLSFSPFDEFSPRHTPDGVVVVSRTASNTRASHTRRRWALTR